MKRAASAPTPDAKRQAMEEKVPTTEVSLERVIDPSRGGCLHDPISHVHVSPLHTPLMPYISPAAQATSTPRPYIPGKLCTSHALSHAMSIHQTVISSPFATAKSLSF